MSTWVFGYGSLVSPTSLGSTLGRTPIRTVDFIAAECDGWERRWNYGYSMSGANYVGSDLGRIDTVVALGVARVAEATMNGVIALVHADELDHLDRRERNYDRVDITDGVRLLEDGAWQHGHDRVVTYVPRQVALDVYIEGRDRGRAGIEIRYWDLVNNAFDALLPGQGDRFRASTPSPDVPVVDVSRVDSPRTS